MVLHSRAVGGAFGLALGSATSAMIPRRVERERPAAVPFGIRQPPDVTSARAHLLGVDDAPFHKGQPEPVPLVAVMMEGHDLVEGVAIGSFPVDGPDATAHLADWIGGLRCHASLQGVVLGGITIAGLGVVDIRSLAESLARPVLVVTRKRPDDAKVGAALRSAGLAERVPIVEASPPAFGAGDGRFVACAGIEPSEAAALATAGIHKAQLPEPLRLAHLIGRALVMGESRGRV